MTWEEVRQRFPNRWIVVEAIGASTENRKQVIPQIAIAGVFSSDFYEAWNKYLELHQTAPDREFYPINTAREETDIGVIDSFGRVLL